MKKLSEYDYRQDILILAGDVTDDLCLLEQCFSELAKKFHKVLFVPGNHEMWVVGNQVCTSLEKYQYICMLAHDNGILMGAYFDEVLSIAPLLGWYDYSFDEPCEKLKSVWSDFKLCVWPAGYDELDVTNYFLRKNAYSLGENNKLLISFSHFLPRIDLMPKFIPVSQRYLYPVLGSMLLGEQVKRISSNIHVYGHRHVNNDLQLDGIKFVNNAFGYPSEVSVVRKELLCIYEI